MRSRRSTLDRVEHYLEYPGDPRAEDVLAKTLRDLGVTGTIGADQDGYPGSSATADRPCPSSRARR